MEQRYAGASGLRLSRVGLGTMTWGRDTETHEAREMFEDFLAAGGTLLDISAGYSDGIAEEVVGELLTTSGVRQDVVLSVQAGTTGWGTSRRVDTSRRAMLASLDASLDRLGTDHVDLWSVQAWSPQVPLAETLSALDVAVTSGRARYAGIANYAGWQTAAAAGQMNQLSRQNPLVATQLEYSLLQRGVEREVLPAARAHGMGAIAWSPLGRGVLTGKYRSGTPADSRAASSHLAAFVAPYLQTGEAGAAARGVVDAVVTAADGLGCSPAEIALAWVRDRAGVTSVVVGSRSAAQLRGALAAEDLQLPAEIRLALDEVSAPPMGYPEV